MSSRIIVGVVAALLFTGAAACTKSEEPKPVAPAAKPEAAPAEKPAMGEAAKPATPPAAKPAEPAAPAEGGEAKPAAPKPEPDADET